MINTKELWWQGAFAFFFFISIFPTLSYYLLVFPIIAALSAFLVIGGSYQCYVIGHKFFRAGCDLATAIEIPYIYSRFCVTYGKGALAAALLALHVFLNLAKRVFEILRAGVFALLRASISLAVIIQKLGQDGAKIEYVQFEAPQTPTTPFVPVCPGAFLHTPVLDTTTTFKSKMQRDKQRSKDAKVRLQNDQIHSTPYIQRHPNVLNAVKIGDNIEYLPRPHLVPLPPSPPVPRPPSPGRSYGFFEDYDDEYLYMEEYEESMRPFYPPRITAPPPPQPSRPSSPGRSYGLPRDDYSDDDSQFGSDDESVIIHDISSPATDNGSDTSNAIAENVFDDLDEASEDFATEFGRMLEAMLKDNTGSESGVSEDYDENDFAVSGAGDLSDGDYSEGEEAMKPEAEQIDDDEAEQEDFDFEKEYYEHEHEEEGQYAGEEHYDNDEEYYEDGEYYDEEEDHLVSEINFPWQAPYITT